MAENLMDVVVAAVPEAMAALTPTASDPRLVALARQADSELPATHPNASQHHLDVVRAAVWLLADDLDRAHELCQNVPDAHGSAWHAVMHRREGDFSNSLYWWRRATDVQWSPVNDRPLPMAIAELVTRSNAPVAASVASGSIYEPGNLVRLAERFSRSTDHASTDLLAEIQRLEWLSLFFTSMSRLKKGS